MKQHKDALVAGDKQTAEKLAQEINSLNQSD